MAGVEEDPDFDPLGADEGKQNEDDTTPLIPISDRDYDKEGARPKEKEREGLQFQGAIKDQDPVFRDRVKEYFDKTEYKGTEYYFGGIRGEEAKKEFKVYPKMDGNSIKVKFGISSNGTIVVSLNQARVNKPYNIDYETGTIKKGVNKGKNLEFPAGIKEVLGKRVEEISLKNFKQIAEEREEEMANTSFIKGAKDEIGQTDDIGRENYKEK